MEDLIDIMRDRTRNQDGNSGFAKELSQGHWRGSIVVKDPFTGEYSRYMIHSFLKDDGSLTHQLLNGHPVNPDVRSEEATAYRFLRHMRRKDANKVWHARDMKNFANTGEAIEAVEELVKRGHVEWVDGNKRREFKLVQVAKTRKPAPKLKLVRSSKASAFRK